MPLITNSKGSSNALGLVKARPDAEPTAPIVTAIVAKPEFQATSVDLKWLPRSHLLTHIEGASWSLEYYSQVLTKDSDLSGQQQSASSAYQSFTLVKELEVKVTSPLSASQDDSTKTMKVEGSAMLYPFVIPNEGDMFIADIGENKKGLFRVTSTIKKSIFKEACYEISYSLDTDHQDKMDDLATKVVKSYYYHKDFMSYGQNPLLVTSEFDAMVGLERQFSVLMRFYMKRFFSNEFHTLMLPCQTLKTYDHFVVDYMLSMFSVGDAPEFVKIKKLSVDDDDAMQSDSLWTSMKKRDVFHLNTSFKQAGLVSARAFEADPLLGGIRYSGFDEVVYPADPYLSADYLHRNGTKTLSYESLSASFPAEYVQPTPNAVPDEAVDPEMDPYPNGDPYAPMVKTYDPRYAMVKAWNLRGLPGEAGSIIKPVTVDNYYVLSESFYSRSESMSALEQLVWDHLERKKLDRQQLLDVSKLVTAWGALEQFYYIPLILTFIRSTIRNL